MKVGVVTTSYPRWPEDAAGNFVGAHVAALRVLGHEVEVIAAGGDHHRHAGDADRRAVGRDDAVFRIPSGGLFYTGGAPDLLEQHPIRGALSAAAFSMRLAAAVAIRARTWDAIIAHWLAPSALAAIPTGAPLLAIAHGGDIHTLRRTRLLAPALHALHARGAELVFVSDELRAITIAAAPLLSRWLAASRVQPMGIDTARFAAIPRTPTDPPTIAIAARLVPIKGVDVAIAALAHLRHRVRLVVAGDGPERSRLREAAVHHGAPEPLRTRFERSNVELLGAIDTRARDRLLGTASLVLVPSRVVVSGRGEGTPLIALEALAAGVPVVASAIGGLRSLAPAAALVPPDDPRALAAAIDRALDAPTPARELQQAVADLDWSRVAPMLVRSA